MIQIDNKIKFQTEYRECNTLVVGSGSAAYNAADWLYTLGQHDIQIVTEGQKMGTSRNTGSDKQTYYKLSLADDEPDSVYAMAKTLFSGGSVDGDTALVEAANSIKSFMKLVNLGVPFPKDQYGQYVGYRTDHDETQRATSCGPLTSKLMTEKLESSVFGRKNIKFMDHVRIVKILVDEEINSIFGAIGIKQVENVVTWVQFNCTNIIYATGGPSGLYRRSVYPVTQTGAHGPAFLAGVHGKNLTEWQYGIASTEFRWNLSGSYQQVIPKYYSVDKDGNDKREFLMDYFSTGKDMLNAIFLKGYQWPFDPRKIDTNGSSIIDIAIYVEEILKKRKVFIDYRENSRYAIKDNSFQFTFLNNTAFEYLENSNALQDTPIERLKSMNYPAYELYASHGIDLEKMPLNISICAQHNNGGLEANNWWESNIKHFFPVGEVCGNFGVYRPGGSALNANQVGSLRAAEYINSHYCAAPILKENFLFKIKSDMDELENFCDEILKSEGSMNVKRYRENFQKRFDECGAYIRDIRSMKKTYLRIENDIKKFTHENRIDKFTDLKQAFISFDLLISELVYLKAFIDYAEDGGKSRGSYLIKEEQMNFDQVKRYGIKAKLDNGKRDNLIQITSFKDGKVYSDFRERHTLPHTKSWFEEIYNNYRNGSSH